MSVVLSFVALLAACGGGRSGVPVPDEGPDRDSLSTACQDALAGQASDSFCTARCGHCEVDNLQPCRTRCLLAEVDSSDEDLATATQCWSQATDCTVDTQMMCGNLETLLDLGNVIGACADDVARLQ